MSLQIGDQAPDFTLFSTDKKEISLSSYKGKKILLLFFPQAFTGVCTEELCSTRDSLGFYNDVNAAVLAISVDSIFTLGKFKQENEYNFELLSDFNKEVSASYGCLYDTFVFKMKGVSKRSAFVIDGTGVIRYTEILEKASEMPNFGAIKDCLRSL